MSRTTKTFTAFVVAIVGPFVCYVLTAFLLAVIATGWKDDAGNGDIAIYVRGDAVHAEFVFPIRNHIMDWSRLIPASDFRSAPAEASFISFGWGERNFYLKTPRWRDFDPAVGLKALSFNNETLLHVYRLSSPRGYSWHRRLEVSEAQYQDLVDYVLSSIRLVDSVPIVVKGAAYGNGDAFYEAEGIYSPFMTCNEWINKGLRSAELNAALWSPFSFGVKWALPE